MNGYVHIHYMYQCLYLPLIRIPKPKTIGLNELEMYFSFTLKNQEVDSVILCGGFGVRGDSRYCVLVFSSLSRLGKFC